MAGGTSKRPGRPSLAERSASMLGHSTVNVAPTHPPGPPKNYGETATYHQPKPDTPRHVWVTTDLGRNPGLLVELRKPEQLPWEALVAHFRQIDGRWTLVREWLPAGAVEPAETVGGHA